MINLIFTAKTVKKDKGCFVAHAEELSINAEPASTQRGAIKKLKTAILRRLRSSAETGTLTNFLDDAGYPSELLGLDNISLKSYNYDEHTVSLPLPRQLSARNRINKHS